MNVEKVYTVVLVEANRRAGLGICLKRVRIRRQWKEMDKAKTNMAATATRLSSLNEVS